MINRDLIEVFSEIAREKNVEVFVDNEIWDSEKILCHPLVNTSTLAVTQDGMRKFLKQTGHNLRLVEVPVK